MEITPPWDFDLLQKMLKRIAELRGTNASINRIKSTLCCVPYDDDIERGLLKLQEPIDDMRDLRLSPVNLPSCAHCVVVNEDDHVYVLKVLGIFSHKYSVQIYHGNRSFVDDIRLKMSFLDQLRFFNLRGRRNWLFYVGEDEGGNFIFYFSGEPAALFGNFNHFDENRFANLYDYDGNVVLSFSNIWKADHNRILHSKDKTVTIPNEHFFQMSQNPNITEIAFVHTSGHQLKGIVGLYPNCIYSPSESPLWDRYLPIIHVTAGGETLRCLHSGENLKVLYSRGF
jgi:hypothetical protein